MPQTYTVKPGDTLSQIGKNFGVDYKGITGYKSGNANLIRPGEVLTIPDAPGATPSPTTPPVASTVPSQATTNPITPSSLTPTTPMPLATPKDVPGYDVSSLEVPQLQMTAQEQKQSGINTELGGLYNQLTGKTAYQAEQDTAYGVDTANKTINDLGSQLTRLKNEALAIPVNLESRAADGTVLRAGLNAEQNKRSRDNAIEALGISTMLSAAQGQLANAQAQADKAVALKFGPIEEKISALKQNLQLIIDDPLTSLQDKNRALKQQAIQDAKASALETAKEREKQVQSIMIEAAKFGADPNTLNAIQNSSTLEEAIANSGGYLSTETKMKQSEIAQKQKQQEFENNLALKKYNLDVRQENRLATAANTAANDNKLLSIADAKALGVPYGTTVGQARSMGITPGQIQAANTSIIPVLQDKITAIDSVLNSKGLSGTVGPNKLARLAPIASLTGSQQNFIASVQQLTNQETLDTLLNLKKAGGTLGALSEGEGKLLRDAATKINYWAIKDKNGNVKGYDASEKDFKAALNEIKKQTNRAITAAQGYDSSVIKPEDLQAVDNVIKSSTPFNPASYFK